MMLNKSAQYVDRVVWHRNHCVWKMVGKTLPNVDDRKRICFELKNGTVLFGTTIGTEKIVSATGIEYLWSEVSKWCYESEDHPGIPVVRTFQ